MSEQQQQDQTIKIISCDNEEFVVPKPIAFMSSLIQQLSSVNGAFGNEIVIPEVSGSVLRKVIEFCTHYQEEPMKEIERPLKSDDMKENVGVWYAEFISMDDATLFKVVTAANYMIVKPLDGGSFTNKCAKIASYIKGKKVEEIRERFHIVNDFTPEEEERIRRENKWADEL